MRTWRATSILLLSLALVACSDDGGDDDSEGGPADVELTGEEQEFADAWSATLQDEEDGFAVAAADADCMGAAIMAELGTKPFDDAEVTAADIGDSASANSPGEVLGAGVIGDDQADAIMTSWEDDCIDVPQVLAESASTDFDLDDEGVACFTDGLREADLARRVLRSSFTSDTDRPDDETLGEIVALIDSCGDGEGGLIVDSIAEALAADGSLTEEQAQCLAQAVVDDMGLDRLAELGGGFENIPPEDQEEVTAALLAAAGACDVPLSAFGG